MVLDKKPTEVGETNPMEQTKNKYKYKSSFNHFDKYAKGKFKNQIQNLFF